MPINLRGIQHQKLLAIFQAVVTHSFYTRHDTYARDIELLRLERAAWTKAETIATDLGLTISQDTVEDHLDSYRDWLHQRSTCPRCNATGIQIDDQHYSCLECDSVWKVNEARNCGLKRYAK